MEFVATSKLLGTVPFQHQRKMSRVLINISRIKSVYMCMYYESNFLLFLSCLVPGRCAVSYMLSLSDNVTSLLPFVEPRSQREHDNKLAKSSVSSRYAAVLLLQLLQSEWTEACVYH